MTAPELKPCPFCEEGKTASTYFDHEQGDKWGYASCDACGARGPEVRTGYDRNDNAPWRGEAIAAWNTRADTATWNAAIRAAADAATYVIQNIDILKPDGETYETPRVQKVARGLVDVARQDILALLKDEK